MQFVKSQVFVLELRRQNGIAFIAWLCTDRKLRTDKHSSQHCTVKVQAMGQ